MVDSYEQGYETSGSVSAGMFWTALPASSQDDTAQWDWDSLQSVLEPVGCTRVSLFSSALEMAWGEGAGEQVRLARGLRHPHRLISSITETSVLPDHCHRCRMTIAEARDN